MNAINTLEVYLMTLSVVQPARIQDIEKTHIFYLEEG